VTLAVLIPAYQPGKALVELARELSRDFAAVVIVDDGSGPAYGPVFEQAEKFSRVEIVRHATNRGKGAALKSGIEHIRATLPDVDGIVTADADGQHAPDDIVRVGRALVEHPQCLVLGSRKFQGDVPWRSRAGNAITRRVVHLVVGQNLSDTQTGLRGIPAILWPPLLLIEADGYEFELEMLIAARRQGVAVQEEPIRTIYQAGNPTSHFNPLVDSMKIYFVLLRFTSVSVMTAVLDNVVFYIAYRRTGHILASQALGRTFAVAFNYWMVRRSVFDSRRRHLAVLPQYLMLVLVSGAASYGGIRLLSDRAGVNPVAAKLAVETLLFFGNFAVQRLLIFRSRNGDEAPSRRVLWISWLVFLSLVAAIGLEVYGFATSRIFDQPIWFPLGIRRLIRYACLFVEAGLPLLLMAPWMFAATAAVLVLAGTAIAAPAGLAATAFFLLSCWALGSKLARGAGAPCSILLGAAVYVFVMTLTSRMPVHYPLAWGALLAVPILADPRASWRALAALAGRIRRAELAGAGERSAFAALVFVVGMHWLVALKPETGADALGMHLAIPVNVAAHHQMTFEPDRILWSVMPMGADWAFTITYLLGGEAAPRLFNFAMLVLLLALAYEAVRRWVPRATAYLLLASFAATPLVQLVTGSLFVENLLAALLLGAVVSLWRFADTGENRFFVAAAALGGSALGVKLAAMAILALVLPFALVEAWRRRLRPGVAALAAVLFAAAAVPSYAIAWRKTGDPLFPFLNQRFPTPLLDRSVVLRDFRFREPLTWHTPFDLTFHSSRYYEGQDGSFGLQYLLLIPLALVAVAAVRRREPLLGAAAALGAMTAVMASEPNIRYLYAALPLLFVPAAALLQWLEANQRWLGRAVIAALAVSMTVDLYLLPASGWYHKEFYSQLVFSRGGKDRFLESAAPARDVALHLARQHPGANVFLAGDNDLADASGEAYTANWHQYRVWEQVQGAADRAAMLKLFEQWNVHYVLGQAPPPGTHLEPAGLRDLVDHCLVREYENHWAWQARVDPACREGQPAGGH
jgi:glycosyltransferase involved in cell wall biosynthesis